MTDKSAELDGYADIPVAERRRIEAQNAEDNRKGLLRNHFKVLDEQHAIEGVQIAMDVHSPEFRAMADKLKG